MRYRKVWEFRYYDDNDKLRFQHVTRNKYIRFVLYIVFWVLERVQKRKRRK